MIRPSGTEPVLKLYAEAVWPVRSRDELAAARASATELAGELLAAAAAVLEPDALEPRRRHLDRRPGDGGAPRRHRSSR